MKHDLQGQPAAIYLRISNDREGLELGVERQEEDCRRLADRLGVRVIGIYKDNDISASTRSKRKRPDYQRLLRDAKSGLVKVVLAYTTSRITRKPRENEDLIELAEDHGALFFYVASPDFDLNTASGRLIARILAAKDAGEAEETAERVARAALQRAEDGKFHGGGRPYGYERDGVTLRDSEAAVYKECVARIIAGESQAAVIRSLNDRGIPSAEGGLWTVGNFKRTLVKKRYAAYDDQDDKKRGIREHHTGDYRAEWPSLISRADYDLMTTRFAQSAQPWAHGLANGRKYLASGLARCGGKLITGSVCDAAMYGQARKLDNGTHQPRYRCKGRDNYAREVGCGKVFRDAAALDEFIKESVLYRLDTPDIARALSEKKDTAQVDELLKKLEGLNIRRRQLAAEHALKPYDDYDIMRATIMGAIGEVEDSLRKLHIASARIVLPVSQPMRQAWDTASIEWQRDIMKLLIEKIVVHPGSPGGRMWNGHRFNPESVTIVWKA